MLMEIPAMDLRTYLFFKRKSLKSLAEEINYSDSQLSAVVNMKRKPGRKLAKLIEKATNGEVTADELLSAKYGLGSKEEDNG